MCSRSLSGLRERSAEKMLPKSVIPMCRRSLEYVCCMILAATRNCHIAVSVALTVVVKRTGRSGQRRSKRKQRWPGGTVLSVAAAQVAPIYKPNRSDTAGPAFSWVHSVPRSASAEAWRLSRAQLCGISGSRLARARIDLPV